MQEVNPRIIHRIYFDNFAPFHDPFEHYLESWHREMPDYEIKRWNKDNLDVDENEWTRIASRTKSPVFLAEYFRWKLLAQYGGVYLDADCEILDGNVLHGLIEDLYASRTYDTFFGVEEYGNGHPTAQTVGARKGSGLVAFMKSLYERNLPELWAWREKRGLIGPQLMSLYFLNQGINTKDDGFFKNLDAPVVVGASKVYPQTYFSPKFTILGSSLDYQAGKTCVYHMFANSNVDFSGKKRQQQAREKALTFAEYSAALAQHTEYPKQFDSSWLSTIVGAQTDHGIVAGEVDGTAIYGPYVSLPPGKHVARVLLAESPDAGTIEVSVTKDLGQSILASRRFALPAPSATLETPPFTSEQKIDNVEVLVRVEGVERVTIRSVEFDVFKQAQARTRGSLKVLHRIYFGFDGKPDQFQTYLQTWKQQLPDYEIVHWNASNLPMDINPYVRKLYEERDHAFLTDYFRWHILREHGGVYLDADVEVVNGRIFNNLIEELESTTKFEAFIGVDERGGGWYTAHSMASKPNSDLSTFMCELYENFGSFTAWRKKGFYFWAPQLVALFFTNRGYHKEGMGTSSNLDGPTIAAGVKIYPQDWFSPLAPSPHGKEVFSLNALTENTCLCHHFACSWHDADSKYLQHSKSNGGQTNVLVKDLAVRASRHRVFGSADLHTGVGIKTSRGISASRLAGYLVFGPYITLGAGTHRLIFSLDQLEDVGHSSIDVVSDQGTTTIVPETRVVADGNDSVTVEFVLQHVHQFVEFRMLVDDQAEFAITNVSVEQL